MKTIKLDISFDLKCHVMWAPHIHLIRNIPFHRCRYKIQITSLFNEFYGLSFDDAASFLTHPTPNGLCAAYLHFQVCTMGKVICHLKIGRILYLDENFIKSNGIPAIIHIISNFSPPRHGKALSHIMQNRQWHGMAFTSNFLEIAATLCDSCRQSISHTQRLTSTFTSSTYQGVNCKH